VPQQTPSTQAPDEHSLAAWQTVAEIFLIAQVLSAVQ